MLHALVAVALVAADPLTTAEEQGSNATVSSVTESSSSCSGIVCDLATSDQCSDSLFPFLCGAFLLYVWIVLAVYLCSQGVIAVAIIGRHRDMKAAGEMPRVGVLSVVIAVGAGVVLGCHASLLTLCFPVDGDGKPMVGGQQHPAVAKQDPAALVGRPVCSQQPVVTQQHPRAAPIGPPVVMQPVVAQQPPRAAPVGPPVCVQHPVILGQQPLGPQRKPAARV